MTGHDVTPSVVAGEGPAMLLVHGLGMSWRAWTPLLETLAVRHRVLAPTLPGHRGGPPAPASVSVSALTDWVEGYLDEQGIGRAHVVGNSLGGWISLELARRGRAHSVTAISPAGGWRHAGDLVRMHVLLRSTDALMRLPWSTLSLLPALQTGLGRRAVLLRLMEHGERVSRAEAAGILRDAHDCQVVTALLRAGRRDGRLAELTGPAPVQVVWGRRDRVIPYARHGRPLAAVLPEATRVSLPGAGHVPMHDAPDRLAELILGLAARADQTVERR